MLEDLVRLVLAGTVEPESAAAVRAAAPTLVAAGRVVERGLLGRRDLADLYLESADTANRTKITSASQPTIEGRSGRRLDTTTGSRTPRTGRGCP